MTFSRWCTCHPYANGYAQFQPPSGNLNANNSKKIKIENGHSQNITPQQPNLQHVKGSPVPRRTDYCNLFVIILILMIVFLNDLENVLKDQQITSS